MARAKRKYEEAQPEVTKWKSSRYTHGQRELVKSIRWNDITIGVGAAGTGKTSATLETALKFLNDDNSPIEKILYVRANVGLRGEKDLGTPPGDLKEKADHLSYPVRDNLAEFMGQGEINALFDLGKIEVTSICNLRGRSLSNTFIILDEAQNCSHHTLKTVITRLGHESKLVLIGDPQQCDTDLNNYKWNSFLKKAETLLIKLKTETDNQELVKNKLSNFVLSACNSVIESNLLPILSDKNEKLPFCQLAIKLEQAKMINNDLAIGVVFFNSREIVRHPILGEIMQWL